MIAAMTDARLLADVGNALCGQLHALALDPTSGRAADVAANLDGARHAVLRLRETALRTVNEGSGATSLVEVAGKHFVFFLHNGREVWSCIPLDAGDAERIVVEQLSEKNWFTGSHREQFAALVADRFGVGDR
ncbi:hypothetical protein ACKVMH_02880 [Lysobacter zhanggongensis]|uniref:Roadblock/LAMTOR2 domain-containing protein n=1 Tax=Lysobacter zhanggongensis TaxID=1774951 RepID=A0ABU7YMY9_9GAMM